MFCTRFYMIWSVNKFDKNHTCTTIFLNCLKFWDQTLLIQCYFGEDLAKRVDDKREKMRTNELGIVMEEERSRLEESEDGHKKKSRK
jgi:hypothetical protein